jgi:hypothetical protein
VALVALVLAGRTTGTQAATAIYVAASVTPASALPRSTLALGVTASPEDLAAGGWVPESGVPWTYTYQYLSGGANTGAGWRTWNAGGQFPVLYAQSARARGAIPVFSYYMLLQSNGPCGSCAEAQKDLAHLNDPSTMTAWYQDFATLMERLGPSGYGGPVIVHVEPDLSGYAEQATIDPGADCFSFCTGGGNNPANLGAAVASTGVTGTTGFPNTYQGFNDAILHLRDLYAPNVALAFHVSDWATLHDVGSDPSSSVDYSAMGTMAGQFAAASGVDTSAPGVSTYDVVFNDVASDDAGRTGTWWDRTNRTLPDFTRWEQYVAAVHAATGRGVMVWQIPVGNQWFDTDDNTAGHYQDNRVEYFLSHPAELAASGIVGLLFGAGNPGDTSQTDAEHDGTTNPAPFCTGDGMGGGQICNDHVSTSPDDDGGYLAIAAAAYYRDPVALQQPAPSGGATPPYRVAEADGATVATGGAGSNGSLTLARPIVGMASTPDGGGYWLVAGDGGIFSFGDAVFHGSTGAMRLNEPIVGMASTPDGGGYWLVAADGGIFSFGDAAFHGSTGAIHLVAPIVGMAATPDGHGYWLAAADGGVFNFGSAGFDGSAAGRHPGDAEAGMAATPTGGGYWLVDSSGDVDAFGDASDAGTAGVTSPAVAISPA